MGEVALIVSLIALGCSLLALFGPISAKRVRVEVEPSPYFDARIEAASAADFRPRPKPDA